MISKDTIEKLSPFIRDAEKIVCIMHKNPDGDAVGASLAMRSVMQNLEKKCTVISPNDYPAFLHWLPGHKDVVVYNKHTDTAKSLLKEADLVFYLDFNMANRIGKVEEALKEIKGHTVMIDHHPEPGAFAELTLSDTSVSSTCELVFTLLDTLGFGNAIDTPAAECLYTGIMTDTGSFSYNSSRPATYHVVSQLLKRGIDKDKVYGSVYDNYSENRMRLLGFMLLERMEVIEEYDTAYIHLSRNDLKRFNYAPGDTEGFVNYPLAIKGIQFTAIFIEKEPGEGVKISFRSKGAFPANEFSAAHFNGGGHKNAAGGHFQGTLQEALKTFRQHLLEYAQLLINAKEVDE
jgi:phosphoesterase RecJ-like protein